MRASKWEFENRALIFGLILAVAFQFYFLDHQIAPSAAAQWLAAKLGVNDEMALRWLLGLGALLVFVAALIRTWASAYLHAEVVYASEVKAEALVADGPYRYVRNPLYFANVLMAIGMGAMMSRPGFFVAVIAMTVFCYRLILREEAELQARQGERYQQYGNSVRRLWPSLRPRIPSSRSRPRWADGFKAEGWYWGFAVSVLIFAATLSIKWFFVALGASLALFWLSSMMLQKKSS